MKQQTSIKQEKIKIVPKNGMTDPIAAGARLDDTLHYKGANLQRTIVRGSSNLLPGGDGSFTVLFNPSRVTREFIRNVIEDFGFSIVPEMPQNTPPARPDIQQPLSIAA